ncbi:MAG: aminoglycoside phosphotransferase family protein [Nocardioidaceae bacterium]
MTLHDNELPIDDDLVRRMIADQLPEHAGAPVRRLGASGSSNALFRLGDEFLVRVPRQPGGSATILKEARWLSYLADALPAGVPEIVALGQPAHGFPENWSVVRWVDGEHPTPAACGTGSRKLLARDLAAVVRALRELEVPPQARTDAALRWYRAEPLTAIDSDIRAYAEQCRSVPNLDLDIDAVLLVWEAAMAAAADGATPATQWLHGDLFAENLLVRNGRLAAVLDFGGLAVGDPTVDLVVAWELLDPESRALFRTEAGLDDHTWLLGRAWALALAVMTFPYYWHTMPERCAGRLAIARQVLMDAELG